MTPIPTQARGKNDPAARPALQRLDTLVPSLTQSSINSGSDRSQSSVSTHQLHASSCSTFETHITRPSPLSQNHDGTSVVSGKPFSARSNLSAHTQLGSFLRHERPGALHLNLEQSFQSSAQWSAHDSANNLCLAPSLSPPPLQDLSYDPSLQLNAQLHDPISTHPIYGNLPPYQFRPPAQAPLLQGSQYGGLLPWTSTGPEDVLDEDAIKRGFIPKLPDTAITVGTARLGLWPILKNIEGLEILENFFEKVTHLREERSRHGNELDPGWVTGITFPALKREMWFRNLWMKGQEKSMSTMPEGMSSEVLLERCVKAAIKIRQTVDLFEAVGKKECAGITESDPLGSTHKYLSRGQWIYNRTGLITQMTRTVVRRFGQAIWKKENDYILRLTDWICQGTLIDNTQFFDIVLKAFSDRENENAAAWMEVVNTHWNTICKTRLYATKLMHVLLDRRKEAPLEDKLVRLFADAPDAFVCPLWRQKTRMFTGLFSTTKGYDAIVRRNAFFEPDGPDGGGRESPIAVKSEVIRLLDGWGGGDISIIANTLFAYCDQYHHLPATLFNWAGCRYRPGRERVYLIAQIIKAWKLKHGLYVARPVLSWLDQVLLSIGKTEKYDWCSIFILFHEISGSGALTLGDFLKWLANCGGLPNGPSRLRDVLLSLYYEGASPQLISIRQAVLARSGYSAQSEQLVIGKIRSALVIKPIPQNHAASSPFSSLDLGQILRSLNDLEGLGARFSLASQVVSALMAFESPDSVAFQSACLLLEGVGDMRSLTELVRKHHRSQVREISRICNKLWNIHSRIFGIIFSPTVLPVPCLRSINDMNDTNQIVRSAIGILDKRLQLLRLPTDPIPVSHLPPSPWSNPPDYSSPSVQRDGKDAPEGLTPVSREWNREMMELARIFDAGCGGASADPMMLSPSRRVAYAYLRSKRPEWLLDTLIDLIRSGAESQSQSDAAERIVTSIVLGDCLQDILRSEITKDWRSCLDNCVRPLLQSLNTYPSTQEQFARRLGLEVPSQSDSEAPRWNWLVSVLLEVDALSLPFQQLVTHFRLQHSPPDAPGPDPETSITSEDAHPLLAALLARTLTHDSSWLQILLMLPAATSSQILSSAFSTYEALASKTQLANRHFPPDPSTITQEGSATSSSSSALRLQNAHYLLRKALPLISCPSLGPFFSGITARVQSSPPLLAHILLVDRPAHPANPAQPEDPNLPLKVLLPDLQLLALLPLLPPPSTAALNSKSPGHLFATIQALATLYLASAHPVGNLHAEKLPERQLLPLYDTLATLVDVLSPSMLRQCAAVMPQGRKNPRVWFLFGGVKVGEDGGGSEEERGLDGRRFEVGLEMQREEEEEG